MFETKGAVMKELMLGNKAFARGLYEAGCKFASSYPGTPSTEITEEAAKYEEIYCEWAPNEKVAMEAAFGASLAGKRAFCGMKHVGLNVAADPLFTMSYTGVRGGLVVGVADDPGMHSSQNEQDTRHHAIASKIPVLEPSDSQETLEFVKIAFDISERFDTPVIVKMCTRISHSQSVVDTSEREERETIPYVKDPAKYVMVPANAKIRHPFVEERTKKLAEWGNTSGINRVEKAADPECKRGFITGSTSYQYIKEVFGDSVSVLKLGMPYPFPDELIKEFAKDLDDITVAEEMDPIVEEHCKALGINVHGKDLLPMVGEYSQNLIAKVLAGQEVDEESKCDIETPVRPPIMCPGCPHRGIFYTLKRNKCIVIGDIGCYTLAAAEPLASMDMTLCMGASVSATHGFLKALGEDAPKNVVGVIGDSTFIHSGMTGLAEIAYNQSNATIVILDNSTTGMTGQQENPTTGYNIKGDPAGKIDLEALVKAMGIRRVRVVDPLDLKACNAVVKEELAADEPSVIITRRPCVLLKSVKKLPALRVNPDKCTGCGACMKIGCPALAMKDGKVVVDETLCVGSGCNLCTQMCGFGAFEYPGEE